MGLLLTTLKDDIVTAALLASKTLGIVSKQPITSLKQRDCRTCPRHDCPLYKSNAYQYLYDDPILEEICSRYWR